MKACPNVNVLRLFNSLGLYFDASSGYEVSRALKAGVPASHICLSAQELPSLTEFEYFISIGIQFNACSLAQLETFGKLFKSSNESLLGIERRQCGVRFNPGVGSGGSKTNKYGFSKTNVGGIFSSFGIWYEYLPEVKQLAELYNINIIRIHTHIGSGSDPAVWQHATHLSLALVEQFPNVHTVNLGGGYKVARMSYEKSTDLQLIGAPVKELFTQLYERTGRKLSLEIEPGTYLVANAGSLLCKVQDKTSTKKMKNESESSDSVAVTSSVAVVEEADKKYQEDGVITNGCNFLKLNAGMTEVLRPSLYGAQHPILLLPALTPSALPPTPHAYVIVGHCCESGDLFSCVPNEPESIREVIFNQEVHIGDYITIESAGAYCSSMSTKNYNSYPEASEVLIRSDHSIVLIRKKQSLEQIIENEMMVDI